MKMLALNPDVLRTKAIEAKFDASAANDGTFSGYGSIFGNVDTYGEIVAPGAFQRSLKELKTSGRSVPVLWQHQTGVPIGNWTKLAEDDRGLFGEGQLWLKEAPQAALAYKGMQTKSITGLSIGYYVKAYEVDQEEETCTLTDVTLVEISIVTSPANDEARVEAVKAKLARGETPRKAEVERYLREAGFSKSQATEIVTRGMQDRRSESDAKENQILSALRGFNLNT